MAGFEQIDLDIHLATPGFFRRPDYFEVLQRLRREDPVHRTADGLVMISRYEDVRTISRDPVRFVSGRGVLINDQLRDPEGTGQNAFSILHLDPPLHATYRSLVNRQFTPRAVARLEQRIRDVVRETFDSFPADEPIDFVDMVAAPIPIAVITEMLGIAVTERRQFRQWSDAAIESTDFSSDARTEQLGQLASFLMEHVRSPEREGDDLLDLLKSVPVGDRPLNQTEIMGFCLTLLIAGNETTRTLLSGGAEVLGQHPEQRAALAADPSLIAGGVEEMLRWVTPIQAFGRTAVVDTDIADRTVTAGEFVVMMYASANRDETVFGSSAASFDVFRPAVPTHLAFGFGEHLCLGASLARLEARIFFDELLARFPDYALAGEPTYTASTLVNGARTMPVSLIG
jgi:cytochrome P450